MSNVHGFGDRSSRRSRSRDRSRRGGNEGQQEDNHQGGFLRLGEPVLEEQIRIAEEHKVIFVSGRRAIKQPQDENYWDMLAFALCPQFSFLSITFLVIVIDLVMFIVSAALGLSSNANRFLEVKADVLLDLGGNYEPDVKNGQVWRLVSAIVLHANFMHLFGNVVATFMFMSRVEYTFGAIKTFIIYFVSGIVANIFSDTIERDTIKVGASTSLYGIIGVIIGYIIINWVGLDLVGPILKCQIYCNAAFIFIFILIFTPGQVQNNDVDFFGHLGGFLAGFFLACIHTTILDTNR